MTVAIMCGGRGLRLHPLTQKTPKPLFNVGGKPILQQIIEGFVEQNFKDIRLCVNYHADLIEHHFKDGRSFGCRITYIHEDEPLGTAGALGKITGLQEPLIVQNGDVLAKVDYTSLLRRHRAENADMTVGLALYQHQLPYGVADFSTDNKFIGLQEKPIRNEKVNSGIYVLEPHLLSMIQGYCDMPDLLGHCERLAYFPIENQWHDCGNFIDLANANNSWV